MSEIIGKLTPRQIEWKGEIERDRVAIHQTLEIALTHHENRMNQMQEKHRDFWKDIADTLGLDVVNKKYRTKSMEGAVCVVEVDDNE